MRRSTARIVAVPVAFAGIAAGIAVAAPSAFAASDLNVVSGSVAVTFTDDYIVQLAQAGVAEFPLPLSDLSADNTSKTVTATFSATGGNANLAVSFGSVDLAGKVVVVAGNGSTVTFSNLVLNVRGADIEATPAGSTTAVRLLDLRGGVESWTGSTPSPEFTDTWQADKVVVDSAGAAYLDNALGTTAFTAGQVAGSASANWTTDYTPPAS